MQTSVDAVMVEIKYDCIAIMLYHAVSANFYMCCIFCFKHHTVIFIVILIKVFVSGPNLYCAVGIK